MKRLLARLIAPSATDGDVLTTVGGKSAWATPTGGGGGGGSPATGVALSRTLTNMAAASGSRVITFDTVQHADTGWTYSAAAGTITVPSTGWYSITAKVRISTNDAGFRLSSIKLGDGTWALRGSQSSSAWLEDHVAGVAYLAVGSVLSFELFSGNSTTVISDAAGATGRTYFRVVKLP